MCQCDAGGVVVDQSGSFARGAWREASGAFADRVARLGPAAAVGAKRCCRCDVDVAGVRRMRDRQGRYWCYACGKADSERKYGAGASIPCPACGRRCRRDAMIDRDGLHVCERCGFGDSYEDRVRARRAPVPSLTEDPGSPARRRRLNVALATLACLSAVSLYRWGLLAAIGIG